MTKLSKQEPIYFDNQATTPVSSLVMECMLPYFMSEYGNPHSGDHIFGWKSRKAVENARSQISAFLNVEAEEIFFTSGATESNNLAILGALDGLKRSGKSKIIISEFEHKCILECGKQAKKLGFEVVRLKPTQDGFISPQDLENILDDEVGLISIMAVNNEIGTVQPIAKLSELAKSRGAIFHTDAAQGGVFLDLNNDLMNVDMLSLSAHKFHGPKGIGAIFIRREIQANISHILFGGGQENGLRSGTLPTMLCVGFGEACVAAQRNREANSEHLMALREQFLESLKNQNINFKINGSLLNRHPGNLNIQFINYDSHSILQALQPAVAASTGSACTTGTPEPSYVLRSLGLTEEEAAASLRFSFGIQNTHQEVITAVDLIATVLSNLPKSEKI